MSATISGLRRAHAEFLARYVTERRREETLVKLDAEFVRRLKTWYAMSPTQVHQAIEDAVTLGLLTVEADTYRPNGLHRGMVYIAMEPVEAAR